MNNQPPDPDQQPPEGGYTWEQPPEPPGPHPWEQQPYDPQQGYYPQDPNAGQYQQPYDSQYQQQWHPPPGGPWGPNAPVPLKHSRWGIAALLCGAVGTILFIVIQIIGPMMASFEPGTIPQEVTAGDLGLVAVNCCAMLLIGGSLLLAVMAALTRTAIASRRMWHWVCLEW